MEDMKKPLVVVLSRIYSTALSVIRSLGAEGYPTDLISSVNAEGKSKPATVSKYLGNSVEIISKKVKDENDGELLDALLAYKGKFDHKIILFPTDDYTASVMDNNRDLLGDIFLMPSLKGGKSLSEHMDKTVQSELAKKAGLNTPAEWKISLHEENVKIPEDMIYPCFVKPLTSFTGYKTEMARCNNREELETTLDSLREHFSNRTVLVQEFLDIDMEIDVSGLCLDQKVILPAVTKKLMNSEHDTGVVITGQMIPVSELGDTYEKLIVFLQSFGYTGMFDMDLNVVGDKIYFGELNLRSGGPNWIYYASGINLPELFVRHLLGGSSTPEEERVKVMGQTFVYEKVAWEEYLNDLITKEELEHCLHDQDVTLLHNAEDPAPGDLFDEEMAHAESIKLQRDACVAAICEDTGWSAEKAKEVLKDARKRTGITYNDYRRNKFWKVPTEEQVALLEEIRAKKERIHEQREACLASAMKKAGWSREQAEEEVKDARQRLGISYNDYRTHAFCMIPAEKQETAYAELMEQKAKNKRNREACIKASMATMGWSEEEAKAHLAEARKRTDVTFVDYKKYEFWKIPAEKQEAEYKVIKERKARIKLQREDCIAAAMKLTGWTREEAEAQIKDARKRLGITYNQYKNYEFAKIPVPKQARKYEKILAANEKKKKKKK